jgi:hypothetical protein
MYCLGAAKEKLSPNIHAIAQKISNRRATAKRAAIVAIERTEIARVILPRAH